MDQWCAPDGCPAFICGGPHVRYVSERGDECLCPPGFAPPAGYYLSRFQGVAAPEGGEVR